MNVVKQNQVNHPRKLTISFNPPDVARYISRRRKKDIVTLISEIFDPKEETTMAGSRRVKVNRTEICDVSWSWE